MRQLLLFHGEILGIPIGLTLLAPVAAIALLYFFTFHKLKSKWKWLFWAPALLLALICFLAGCLMLGIGIEEFYYMNWGS